MTVLSVNGVVLPVAVDSLRLAIEEVGSRTRNARGLQIVSRLGLRTSFSFSLSPCPLDEAMMYRSLILGDGEFWGLTANQYGAKGLALTGTGAWSGSGGGNPYATNGVWRTSAGQTLAVPAHYKDQNALGSATTAHQSGARTGATLFGWRRDDAGGTWRIFGFSWRSYDSLVQVKREKLGALGASAAAQNYTGTETLSISSGVLTITAPAGGPYSWSNLYVLPWYCPQEQVDQLLDGLASLPYAPMALPRVYVQTTLLPASQLSGTPGLSNIACVGSIDSIEVQPLARAGALQTTDCVLSATLTEI